MSCLDLRPSTHCGCARGVCVRVRACVAGAHLPAGVGGLPLQDVLGERRRLQLVLVKGHLVYDHGLGVQA